MLRLTEVASQSVTFVKPVLRKAKTNTLNSIIEMDGPSGHYLVVFSLDRPPLLAVRQALLIISDSPRNCSLLRNAQKRIR